MRYILKRIKSFFGMGEKESVSGRYVMVIPVFSSCVYTVREGDQDLPLLLRMDEEGKFSIESIRNWVMSVFDVRVKDVKLGTKVVSLLPVLDLSLTPVVVELDEEPVEDDVVFKTDLSDLYLKQDVSIFNRVLMEEVDRLNV